MLNAVFVIWRECFEAILIVGIIHSYLKRQGNFNRSKKFLHLGIAGGLALCVILAYAIQNAQTELQGKTLDYFQTGMLAAAALLMTHMCIWMNKHSRSIKKELEQGLSKALTTSHLIGISFLTALAIAREGSEAVIFIYGMGLEAQEGGVRTLLSAAGIGIALTAVTAFAFYRGLKIFNPKWFFRVTSVFLLLTASTLLLMAVRRMIQADLIPPLKDPIWDTSAILDEREGLGRWFASMTGYQSTPPMMIVLVATFYWVTTLFFYFKSSIIRPKAPQLATN